MKKKEIEIDEDSKEYNLFWCRMMQKEIDKGDSERIWGKDALMKLFD